MVSDAADIGIDSVSTMDEIELDIDESIDGESFDDEKDFFDDEDDEDALEDEEGEDL